MGIMLEEPSPAGVKAALEIKKLASNFLRLPLVPVNTQTYKLLQQLLES